MRLLIITQKVDRDDPVLGFFHGWIAKLAENFETMTVIALGVGRYDLPTNVKVFSLGKERGGNKLSYVFQFFNHSFFQSLNYDCVFVHMNQEYILLGGLFWKMMGKKAFFWRNHAKGSLSTRIAVLLSNKVFYTSPSSYTARFKKVVQMPVGIDTERFKAQTVNRKKNSILMLGRVSPIKNIHVMLEAARILRNKNVEFALDIVGDPANPEDVEYKKKLISDNKDLIGGGWVNFMMAVPNDKTPSVYSEHEIFVNLTASGSMDKTILEAVACGCMPVVSNPYFASVFDQNMITSEVPQEIAEKLEFSLKAEENVKKEWREKMRTYVETEHGLGLLIEKLTQEIK